MIKFSDSSKVYKLLKNHPILKEFYTEFFIDDSKVKNVAVFMFNNNTSIVATDLKQYYANESFLNSLCTLYGFTPPIDDHISVKKTSLREVLVMTVYVYKFGAKDNFYEKAILDFIPEYDRDQIKSKPKMKLTMESVGRLMDQLETKIAGMKDLMDIDNCPEEFLDYLGQLLGYEREDFTLSNFSFRELLKNIIEIYKIKGTNYSFSFFFKFLGFEINLKEFYFSRDVKNPESFPGAIENRVEYYLTTRNPLEETEYGIPQPHLDQTKKLNDFTFEQKSLIDNGCSNPIQYLLGVQPYNNSGNRYHSNPWRYFKANLIEYQLTPFIDRLNLTASDNETIKKYIKFLSPAYLFTWINVYLNPWIETVDLITDEDDAETEEKRLKISIIKNLGYWEGGMRLGPARDGQRVPEGIGKYIDHEKMEDYLALYEPNGEKLSFQIFNNLNIGGDDRVGSYLYRDGTHSRKPDNPNWIGKVYHKKELRAMLDRLNVFLKDVNVPEYDGIAATSSNLPTNVNDGDIFYVQDTNQILKYNSVYYVWREISYGVKKFLTTYDDLNQLINIKDGDIYEIDNENSYYIYSVAQGKWLFYSPPGLTSQVSQYYMLAELTSLSENDIYLIRDTKKFYKYVKIDAHWSDVSKSNLRLKYYDDYSTRTYPDVPSTVFPINYSNVANKNFKFTWNNISGSHGYKVQVARDTNFSNIISEKETSDAFLSHDPFDNDVYFWKICVKNSIGDYMNWSSVFKFTLIEKPFPYGDENINKVTKFVTAEYNYSKFTYTNFNIMWDKLGDAENYLIDLYQKNVKLPDGTYGDKLLASEETNNTYLPVTLTNGAYNWKLRYRIRGTGAISDKHTSIDNLYVNGEPLILSDGSNLGVYVNYVVDSDFTINFPDL